MTAATPTRAFRVLRALPVLMRVSAVEMTAYRAEVVIWILTSTLPLVMLAIWDAVAADGPIAGMNQGDLSRYFVVTLVARQLTASWIIWELNLLIRGGGLSAHLLRPLHPLWFQATRHWVSFPLRLTVLAPIVAAFVVWRPDLGLMLEPERIAVFLFSCALAWCLVFAFQVCFGCLAFFTGQSLGVFNVWFGLWSLFGGYLLPLQLMPPGMRAVADYLPFRCMLSVPVEMGAGLLPMAEWPFALGLQAAWLLVAALGARMAWQVGLGRYGAFGA